MPAASEGASAALIPALTREIEALRQQLGSAQDRLVETAIEAGELHARIEALGAELAETRAGRNAWRAEAERLVEWANRRA